MKMRKILAYASAVLALATQAQAADLYEPAPPVEMPAVEQPVVSANGWYLRGDISYDLVNMRGAKFFQGDNDYMAKFDKADVDNTGNLGVGVGYQINDYFRTDTTFDYMFSAKFRGSTHGSCGSAVTCRSTDISDFSAYSLMANAYVDITKMGIFTPYVGVGIGGTHISWDGLKNTSCNANNPDDCDTTVTHKGRDSWRFTYAVMAGTSIDINCKLKADVGYRYRNIAAGNMFGYKLNGGPGYDKGFDIHEGRVGVRYAFGDSDCQQAYLPPMEVPQQQPVFK
jgi:opacity protein-like surface antigen